MKIRTILRLTIALLLSGPIVHAQVEFIQRADPIEPSPGFLVVAPDRGFLGNEEIRDAFVSLEMNQTAELVFATDERTRDMLQSAVDRLQASGAPKVVLLPLFISSAHPRYQMVLEMLEQCPSKNPGKWREAVRMKVPIEVAKVFGESYFAVEVLADRIRHLDSAGGKKLLVVGYGANDSESRQRMEADWQRIADHAVHGTAFAAPQVFVWYDWSSPNRDRGEAELTQELKTASEAGGTLVLPFHLGRKLDSMMSLNTQLRRILQESAVMVAEQDATPHPHLATWLVREANKFSSIRQNDLGIVFLAHGSDFHWNENMREAVSPILDRYKIEFAFSMADPPIIERAVRRLEKRGARAIIVLRVFGMESSFKSTVERLIGLDIEDANHELHEREEASRQAATHPPSRNGGHGHETSGGRIITPALLTTAGGLEDHRFFAAALLDRANGLSVDPKHETIILTAHGSGTDSTNEHWRRIMESIADTIRDLSGGKFRDIRTVTWREDWPHKRGPEIEAARQMVVQATQDNGRAIVIPARTTLQGPERKFLEGLEFELGRGFAPHPLFIRWIEEQIELGLASFKRPEPPIAACCVNKGSEFPLPEISAPGLWRNQPK